MSVGLGAFRCIVWDCTGSILECFGSALSVSSVFMAEALAFREACVFCLKAGLKGVILESDILLVVDWCKSLNSAAHWDCLVVVENICRLYISFEFVRREGNLATHLLAKHLLRNSPIKDVFCLPQKLYLSLCNDSLIV